MLKGVWNKNTKYCISRKLLVIEVTCKCKNCRKNHEEYVGVIVFMKGQLCQP